MAKIEKISPKLIAKFPAYVHRWTEIGLCTEPADWARFEVGVNEAYAAAGLPAPALRFRMASPMAGAICAAILASPKLQEVLGKRAQVRDQVGDQVRDQVWDQVWAQVRDQVRDQVWAQVRDQVWAQVRDQVRVACWGQHDVSWLAFYDYFNNELGLKKQTAKLTGLWNISQAGGWWWPFKGAVIMTDRPCALHRDGNGRLHNESGMALEYRDGWGIYAIGGVRVDEQIVLHPETQTVEQIKKEGNAEIKRIRIERFGWDKYLAAIEATVIDHRHNPLENTAEALVRAADGMTVLLPTCKTGRMFALEVPPNTRTCEEAQNYLHSGSAVDALIGKTRVIGRS